MSYDSIRSCFNSIKFHDRLRIIIIVNFKSVKMIGIISRLWMEKKKEEEKKRNLHKNPQSDYSVLNFTIFFF